MHLVEVPEMTQSESTPPARPRNARRLALWMGLGALTLGIFDTWLLLKLGLEFELSGRDGTLFMGGFLALSFGMFGWFWGLALVARKQEQHAAQDRNTALFRLAEAQSRVAQMEKMAALGQVGHRLLTKCVIRWPSFAAMSRF